MNKEIIKGVVSPEDVLDAPELQDMVKSKMTIGSFGGYAGEFKKWDKDFVRVVIEVPKEQAKLLSELIPPAFLPREMQAFPGLKSLQIALRFLGTKARKGD